MATAAAYAHKPQLRPSIDALESVIRRQRRRRLKFEGFARRFTLCIVPLVLLLMYVGLMAGLTVQNYRLAAAQQAHAALVERNNALRNRVAALESVDRLQAAARQLHMTEPRAVAFISPPAAGVKPQAHAMALFVRIAAVTRWIGVR